jgi:dipeptidyl aminopeptidase/acylaminoacyl peptidase
VSEGVKERCRFLAQQGFIVFAPSYRGEDDSGGEIEVASGEIDDVLAALAILREHPGIQRDRFVMMGTSHGALISLHVAASPLGRELIKGVVAAYGVMDIYSWYRYLVENDFDVSDPLSQRVYGNGPQDRPEAFAARHALPLAEKLGPAPVMLVQGAKDRIVPAQQAGRMHEALMAAGRRQDKLRVYPLGEHGFLFWDDPELHSQEELAETGRAWEEILQFLHACLEE